MTLRYSIQRNNIVITGIFIKQATTGSYTTFKIHWWNTVYVHQYVSLYGALFCQPQNHTLHVMMLSIIFSKSTCWKHVILKIQIAVSNAKCVLFEHTTPWFYSYFGVQSVMGYDTSRWCNHILPQSADAKESHLKSITVSLLLSQEVDQWSSVVSVIIWRNSPRQSILFTPSMAQQNPSDSVLCSNITPPSNNHCRRDIYTVCI